jgi:hypothetical protein
LHRRLETSPNRLNRQHIGYRAGARLPTVTCEIRPLSVAKGSRPRLAALRSHHEQVKFRKTVAGAVMNGIRAGSRQFLGVVVVALWALPNTVCADEVFVTAGQGPQPGSDQRNETVGFDYSFYRFERSERQHVTVGVSYTRLTTNAAADGSLYAVSVYPQITLFPSATSRIGARSPRWARNPPTPDTRTGRGGTSNEAWPP